MMLTSLSEDSALPTSMPIKEEPTMTIFLPFFSPTAERMACTSGIVRRRKILERSLKPGKGRAFGVPPVARTSLVYWWEEPEAVETVLDLKSMLVTSSWRVSIEEVLNHSCDRHSSFDLSAIRALDSLVRSIGRYDSLEMMVIAPLKFCSRSA